MKKHRIRSGLNYPQLDNDEVFAHIGRSSKSVLLEIISDDNEALELTYELFLSVLMKCGLEWGPVFDK